MLCEFWTGCGTQDMQKCGIGTSMTTTAGAVRIYVYQWGSYAMRHLLITGNLDRNFTNLKIRYLCRISCRGCCTLCWMHYMFDALWVLNWTWNTGHTGVWNRNVDEDDGRCCQDLCLLESQLFLWLSPHGHEVPKARTAITFSLSRPTFYHRSWSQVRILPHALPQGLRVVSCSY